MSPDDYIMPLAHLSVPVPKSFSAPIPPPQGDFHLVPGGQDKVEEHLLRAPITEEHLATSTEHLATSTNS